jgi:hypothetical protein
MTELVRVARTKSGRQRVQEIRISYERLDTLEFSLPSRGNSPRLFTRKGT